MKGGRLLQMSGVIVDLLYRVEAVPLPGEEAIVTGFAVSAGGGFNAMVAGRRAGMNVFYGGAVGAGPFGDIADRALREAGIVMLRPRSRTMDQGCCTVMIDSDGERTFVAHEGAEGTMSDDDTADINARDFDWLLLSGYALGYAGSRDALTRWLRQLSHQPPLVFDPSPLIAQIPAPARAAALSRARWISANAREAAWITGQHDPAVAVLALAHDRARDGGAVVRDGANGCFLAMPGGPAIHVPGHPVDAIDTNGAGDAHVGAFIAALARGFAAPDAARYANAAAAISTTQEGPATAPSHDDILSALAQGPRLEAG